MTDAITYTTDTDALELDHLSGFFDGWPDPPSPETHLEILRQSHLAWLAIADTQVVGFITAVSDGILSAYIPLLEVLPEFQRRGIASDLTQRMLESLDHLYMVDLLCDRHVQPFYARLGMQEATGMLRRNYPRQNGSKFNP